MKIRLAGRRADSRYMHRLLRDLRCKATRQGRPSVIASVLFWYFALLRRFWLDIGIQERYTIIVFYAWSGVEEGFRHRLFFEMTMFHARIFQKGLID